ncbi:hypothetical protein EON64_16055, partial [archaeon]
MPTPLETHKTYDQKVFFKAGDVGQLLQVCEDREELQQLQGGARPEARTSPPLL